MKKFFVMTLGSISLLIGGIGAVLPVLPTTPFVILAAGCFASSSPSLYKKIAKSPVFGEFICNYREKTGLCMKTRIFALIWLWGVLAAAMVMQSVPAIRIVLSAIGIAVSIHILTIRRKPISSASRTPLAGEDGRHQKNRKDNLKST